MPSGTGTRVLTRYPAKVCNGPVGTCCHGDSSEGPGEAPVTRAVGRSNVGDPQVDIVQVPGPNTTTSLPRHCYSWITTGARGRGEGTGCSTLLSILRLHSGMGAEHSSRREVWSHPPTLSFERCWRPLWTGGWRCSTQPVLSPKAAPWEHREQRAYGLCPPPSIRYVRAPGPGLAPYGCDYGDLRRDARS